MFRFGVIIITLVTCHTSYILHWCV